MADEISGRQWGWRLVIAILLIGCLPMMGLLWTKAWWMQAVIVAWASAALFVGNRLIDWDVRREH